MAGPTPKPAETLEAEVASRAMRDSLLAPSEDVLVAVSGGADSAALAALLAAGREHGLPLRLVLGHVEHGWRGEEEAAADRVAVGRLALLLGLPLCEAGPPEEVRRTEDDARRFRYAALARLARGARCRKVATGHHLRDQAETFLMRLLRGSGSAGLAGIPPRRPLHEHGADPSLPLEVVRPVLWVDPTRLRAYAVERRLPFHEDATNACLDYDRARVRARLAGLDDRGAALARDLAAAAARFRARLERREAEIGERLRAGMAVHVEAEAVAAEAAAIAALPRPWVASALRVLGVQLAADRDGPWFTRRHADLAAALARGGSPTGSVPFPRGIDLHRFGDRLVLSRRERPRLEAADLSGGEGTTSAGAFRASRQEVPAAAFDVVAWRAAHAGREGAGPPWSAAFDAERLGQRLRFRGVGAGDRFVPLGRCGDVAVGSFLGKQGVPEVLRRGVRVAESDTGIAWVLGHRIDARYAVTSRTRTVAVLEAGIRP